MEYDIIEYHRWKDSWPHHIKPLKIKELQLARYQDQINKGLEELHQAYLGKVQYTWYIPYATDLVTTPNFVHVYTF